VTAVRLLETRLEGPVLLEPEVHGDSRGFFVETARTNTLAELGIELRTSESDSQAPLLSELGIRSAREQAPN
jgi:dTDP-4-dehydrorhamnose 3,5-epimerase-like enzyme